MHFPSWWALIIACLFIITILSVSISIRILMQKQKYLRDISAQKQTLKDTQQQESFLKQVIESIDNPFYVINVKDFTIKLANSAAGFEPLTPYSTCHALTHRLDKPCEDDSGHPCPVREVVKSKKSVVVEHLHYDHLGNARYYEIHGHPIFDAGGNVVRMIEYSLDITERKRMELMLKTMASVDVLTGLYNRRGFMETAARQIALACREMKQSILFFLDMDNLKLINDTYGHNEGDRALIEVNNLLRYTFRESDIIARIGGDEFAVLSIENTMDSGRSTIERLHQNIGARNARKNHTYRLSVSVGTMLCPPGQKCSLDDLLRQADKQMYEQKLRKKNTSSLS